VCISGSIGLLVLRIAEAIEKGYSHDQIVTMADKWIKDTKILVTIQTIKYLIKGGRLSTTKGFLAGLLHINPIISLNESGKAIVFDKGFNKKSNMEKIVALIRNKNTENPIWNYIVLHANNPEAAEWYRERMVQITGKEPVSVMNISPIIGANIGAGASAVAYMNE